MLENLFENTCSFSRPRSVARMGFGRTTHEGAPASSVHDHGVGFHRFVGLVQRFHSPEGFPGSGIGLAIVHRIIRRHGGHHGAVSRPGRGARFCFTQLDPFFAAP